MVSAPVKFDDTATAFSYKSDRELRKANFIFTVVNNPIISRLATGSVKLGMWLHLPIKGLIRSTVFSHFCGGETIEKTEQTVQHLGEFNVKTILDYSVEGEKTESGFDATTEEILETFDKASRSKSIPFCVFKVTGMADAALLERMQSGQGTSNEDKVAIEKVRARVDRICLKAHAIQIPILIDAEETWIQGPIDTLAYEMMAMYNKERTI